MTELDTIFEYLVLKEYTSNYDRVFCEHYVFIVLKEKKVYLWMSYKYIMIAWKTLLLSFNVMYAYHHHIKSKSCVSDVFDRH